MVICGTKPIVGFGLCCLMVGRGGGAIGKRSRCADLCRIVHDVARFCSGDGDGRAGLSQVLTGSVGIAVDRVGAVREFRKTKPMCRIVHFCGVAGMQISDGPYSAKRSRFTRLFSIAAARGCGAWPYAVLQRARPLSHVILCNKATFRQFSSLAFVRWTGTLNGSARLVAAGNPACARLIPE